MKESLLSKYVTNCSLNCHQRCHFKTGQLSSWLSSWGVISCQNWNVWACDWLANACLHLAPSVSTGLLMATITFPLSLHSTLYLPTITILPPANEWSNGQASPSTCTTSSTKKSQSENSLKSKYEAKNKTNSTPLPPVFTLSWPISFCIYAHFLSLTGAINWPLDPNSVPLNCHLSVPQQTLPLSLCLSLNLMQVTFYVSVLLF